MCSITAYDYTDGSFPILLSRSLCPCQNKTGHFSYKPARTIDNLFRHAGCHGRSLSKQASFCYQIRLHRIYVHWPDGGRRAQGVETSRAPYRLDGGRCAQGVTTSHAPYRWWETCTRSDHFTCTLQARWWETCTRCGHFTCTLQAEWWEMCTRSDHFTCTLQMVGDMHKE